MHPTLWDFTRSPCAQPQARPTLQISFLTALHRRIIWSSSQLPVRRRPSLRSSSVSDRNHTPLSGAFSQVCKLENVSHSCNHQHNLFETLCDSFQNLCNRVISVSRTREENWWVESHQIQTSIQVPLMQNIEQNC
jgi:hypothetical protein